MGLPLAAHMTCFSHLIKVCSVTVEFRVFWASFDVVPLKLDLDYGPKDLVVVS